MNLPPAPTCLSATPWDGYALLDSGNLRKLERFGGIVVDRPEPQALWKPSLPPSEWAKANAAFTTGKDTEDEDAKGSWQYKTKMPDEWRVPIDGINCLCRLSAFRHMGLFPEQRPHWQWMADKINGRPLRVLNLFGYTGAASLVCAKAGAQVTHVDASKKAIAWAKDNQAASAIDPQSIRWICDDAQAFVAREIRRGKTYDAIVLDPPKHGHGPDGEVWELSDHLPALLDNCRALMSDTPAFVILTAYAMRLSALTLHHLMAERFTGGAHDYGELLLPDTATNGTRPIPISMFARWVA